MTVELDPTAKAAVVHGSVRQYAHTHLASTFSAGAAIDYGGEPFNDTQYAEWVQVRLMQPARPARMDGPRAPEGYFGRELFHMLSLNLFVRPAKLATPNSLRLQTLRDVVAAYFVPNTKIPVRDYADDSVTLGNLVVFETDADRQVMNEREMELQQWNLMYSLRWSERWNPGT